MLQFEFDFNEPYKGSGRPQNPDAYVTLDKPCPCGSRTFYKVSVEKGKRRCVPCQRKRSFAISRKKSSNPFLQVAANPSGTSTKRIKRKIKKYNSL